MTIDNVLHSLITGGAGFIGSHLAEALLARGERVTVMDNLSTGSAENLAAVRDHPQLRFVEGCISNAELLEPLVAEADTIYHLAAAVGVKLVAEDPVHTIETNIYPTELLLRLTAERARPVGGQGPGVRSRGSESGIRSSEAGAGIPTPKSRKPKAESRTPIPKIFLASTSEVYGKNPQDRLSEEDSMVLGPTTKARWAYGCSKAIDEFLALAYHRQFGLPVVIGRFFNVVGPRQVGHYGMVVPRFIDQALAGGPIVVYDDGQQVRCFAHVKDVVRGVIELMHTPEAVGRTFNIGSDEPITIRQLAEEVAHLVNPRVAIEHVPYSQVYSDGFEDIRRRVPDLSRLRQTIGYQCQYRLKDILKEIVESKS